jgi:hypothetical protein
MNPPDTPTPDAAPAPLDAPAAESTPAYGTELEGTYFPYIDNARHWDVDFNDTHQSYEGDALPGWLLAGWAAFIVWAIAYLILALR